MSNNSESTVQNTDGITRRFSKNGLVYNELIVDAADGKWHLRSRGSIRKLENFIGRTPGAPSLQRISLRKLALLLYRNPKAVDLTAIPWPIAKLLWTFLSTRMLVSLEVWKTFVKMQASTDGLIHHGIQHYDLNAHHLVRAGTWERSLSVVISPSDTELIENGNGVSRPLAFQMTFLTFLDIANVKVARSDLLFIPEILNLGILRLGPDVQVVSDRTAIVGEIDEGVYRSWGKAAHAGRGCFHALRVMTLNQRNQLNQSSLQWLGYLPSLSHICLAFNGGLEPDHRFDRFAQATGWAIDPCRPDDRAAKETCDLQLLHYPRLGECRLDGSGSHCCKLSQYACHQQLHSSNNTEIADRCEKSPVLHFQLVGLNSKISQQIRLRSERLNCYTRMALGRSEKRTRRSADGHTRTARNPIKQDDEGRRQIKKSKFEDTQDTLSTLLL